MNNRTLEKMLDHDFDFDEIFEDNKHGMLAMIIGDLSYMEGYIKALEEMNKELKERLDK